MRTILTLTAAAVVLVSGESLQAQQLPTPSPEVDILKQDVGTWDVDIKSMGQSTKGTETNRMMGGFWLIVNFEGKMMGLDFQGHGVYGYDPKEKQYVGTWVDSMSPASMKMTGTYNKETKTLTYVGEGPGPDGSPMTYTMDTAYKGGGRVMTMHVEPKGSGQKVKMFEMTYTKKADK